MEDSSFSEIITDNFIYSVESIASLANIQCNLFKNKAREINVRIVSHYICPAFFPFVWSLPYCGLQIGKRIILSHTKTQDELSKDVVLYGVDKHFLDSKGELSKDCLVPFCFAPSLDDSIAVQVQKIVDGLQVNKQDLKAAITSQIMEVFSNSFEHGHNSIGSFFNSYYDSSNQRFRFTLYDLGDGFSKAIKKQNPNMFFLSGSDAIEWAMQPGHSTKVKDYPRGVGYTVLQEFVTANSGKIFLCTDNYICEMDNNGRSYIPLNAKIHGTFFTMDIGL